MLIIGCDFHPSMQQVAWMDTETGEWGCRRLPHRAETEQFYREVKKQQLHVRFGTEATGQAHWFERFLQGLDIEVPVDDALGMSRIEGVGDLDGARED